MKNMKDIYKDLGLLALVVITAAFCAWFFLICRIIYMYVW